MTRWVGEQGSECFRSGLAWCAHPNARHCYTSNLLLCPVFLALSTATHSIQQVEMSRTGALNDAEIQSEMNKMVRSVCEPAPRSSPSDLPDLHTNHDS